MDKKDLKQLLDSMSLEEKVGWLVQMTSAFYQKDYEWNKYND